jgi:hypothetical protein
VSAANRTAARRLAGATLAAWGLLLASASDVAACSSCFSATEATRQAYDGTTLLLLVLPFALAGALGLWLRRAARRARGSSQLPGEARASLRG